MCSVFEEVCCFCCFYLDVHVCENTSTLTCQFYCIKWCKKSMNWYSLLCANHAFERKTFSSFEPNGFQSYFMYIIWGNAQNSQEITLCCILFRFGFSTVPCLKGKLLNKYYMFIYNCVLCHEFYKNSTNVAKIQTFTQKCVFARSFFFSIKNKHDNIDCFCSIWCILSPYNFEEVSNWIL